MNIDPIKNRSTFAEPLILISNLTLLKPLHLLNILNISAQIVAYRKGTDFCRNKFLRKGFCGKVFAEFFFAILHLNRKVKFPKIQWDIVIIFVGVSIAKTNPTIFNFLDLKDFIQLAEATKWAIIKKLTFTIIIFSVV